MKKSYLRETKSYTYEIWTNTFAMYAHASAFAAFHENGLDNRFQFIGILRRIYDKISGMNDKKKLALINALP